jgi:hypothetical protein
MDKGMDPTLLDSIIGRLLEVKTIKPGKNAQLLECRRSSRSAPHPRRSSSRSPTSWSSRPPSKYAVIFSDSSVCFLMDVGRPLQLIFVVSGPSQNMMLIVFTLFALLRNSVIFCVYNIQSFHNLLH